MVTSSLSLSISFRCSWSLWHPITVLMVFWQDSCCQAMILVLIDCCDVTTSRSKSMYSGEETSVESSLTKLSNYSSSAKSVNWTSSWLFWNPHFLKQLSIVSSETSPRANLSKRLLLKRQRLGLCLLLLHYHWFSKSRTSKVSYDTWVWNFWWSLHLTVGAWKSCFLAKTRPWCWNITRLNFQDGTVRYP